MVGFIYLAAELKWFWPVSFDVDTFDFLYTLYRVGEYRNVGLVSSDVLALDWVLFASPAFRLGDLETFQRYFAQAFALPALPLQHVFVADRLHYRPNPTVCIYHLHHDGCGRNDRMDSQREVVDGRGSMKSSDTGRSGTRHRIDQSKACRRARRDLQ